MYAFEFQTDKDGKISIVPEQFFYQPRTLTDHEEITLAEFKKAMKALEGKIGSKCLVVHCSSIDG